ncbi:MAG: glutamate-5-semialdehyde dehydrogenase, partial [Hyphomicrobiaceae bacterium]|nr:glutamate-5-semialdehyde dehydrogenase [Hyphomicrobiaceae bacterium]
MNEQAAIAGADLGATMTEMGHKARLAARQLARLPGPVKDAALHAIAGAIRARAEAILEANRRDMAAMQASGTAASFMDRARLDAARIEAIAEAVEAIAALADPVGAVMAAWERPNGLKIERVRTPLGVIGVIYESRPNVTADAAALCLKAGNAVILRGGSDCLNSNLALAGAIAEGLKAAGVDPHAIQVVATPDRAAVGMMLSGLSGAIDVIVPRGGKSLVARVQSEARVPVFAHLEGLCHVYLDKGADLDMAKAIAVNSKMRRVSICGSAETLLVDRAAAERLLPPVAEALAAAGCELRGDSAARALVPAMGEASEEDYRTEYLAPILSVAVVDGVEGALAHIARYGSSHTESIVTGDDGAAQAFLDGCDSAIVLHNASTQF